MLGRWGGVLMEARALWRWGLPGRALSGWGRQGPEAGAFRSGKSLFWGRAGWGAEGEAPVACAAGFWQAIARPGTGPRNGGQGQGQGRSRYGHPRAGLGPLRVPGCGLQGQGWFRVPVWPRHATGAGPTVGRAVPGSPYAVPLPPCGRPPVVGGCWAWLRSCGVFVALGVFAGELPSPEAGWDRAGNAGFSADVGPCGFGAGHEKAPPGWAGPVGQVLGAATGRSTVGRIGPPGMLPSTGPAGGSVGPRAGWKAGWPRPTGPRLGERPAHGAGLGAGWWCAWRAGAGG